MGGLSDAVDSIDWTMVVRVGNRGRSEERGVDGGTCGRRSEFRRYVYRIVLRLALILEPDRLGGIGNESKKRRWRISERKE